MIKTVSPRITEDAQALLWDGTNDEECKVFLQDETRRGASGTLYVLPPMSFVMLYKETT